MMISESSWDQISVKTDGQSSWYQTSFHSVFGHWDRPMIIPILWSLISNRPNLVFKYIDSLINVPHFHLDDLPSPRSHHSSSNNSSGGGNRGTPKGSYELDDAQKKFGSAKAISSDQFFGNEPDSYESKSNLTRFQGSNSISSADYFADGTSNTSSGRRGNFF